MAQKRKEAEELRRAEEALRHSEERYRFLFNAIDEGFCVIEVLFDERDIPVDYVFLEVNAAFERQTGLVQAVGKSMRALAPEHEAHWFEIYGRVALTGEPIRFENQAAALGRWYDVYAFRLGEPEERKVAVLFKDIAERKQVEERIRDSELRLRRLFQQAPGFVCFLREPSHIVEFANEAFHQLVGDRSMLGKPVREAFPELEGQGFFELLDRASSTGEAFVGRGMRIALRRGPGEAVEQRFIDFVYQPIVDAGGKVSGIFVQGSDVTERQRADVQRRLLMDELDHRVKNILATVQSIAQQTVPSGDAAEIFAGRLAALARVHGLLVRDRWKGAELRALVEETLAPYRRERIALHGEPALLEPKAAQILAMVLHELATNAAKYGALSSAEGRLNVCWRIEPGPDGRRLALTWDERGGPATKPPERSGFGGKLIRQGVAYELGGETRLDYRPEGLLCTLVVPLRAVAEGV
jgi:PAS domain S-box-containing protein